MILYSPFSPDFLLFFLSMHKKPLSIVQRGDENRSVVFWWPLEAFAQSSLRHEQ